MTGLGGVQSGFVPIPVQATRLATTPSPAAPGTDPAQGQGDTVEHGALALLSIRVPTTTPPISDERRDAICSCIQPGDIILETDDAYPGWQRMEFLTMRSNYTHAAIYEGDGKFIEATPPKVCRTELRPYLEGNQKICIVRPAYVSEEDKNAALEFARKQIGKPYDGGFSLADSEALYCAELVYNALKSMPHPMEAPLHRFLGRDVVAPDSFQRLPGATAVYDEKAEFWQSQLTHWPVMASGAGVAAAAAYLGGPIAGVAGFAGGLVLSILVGNKIQTGHFNFAGMPK